MPLLTVVAAASFACLNPAHVDGASIRCEGRGPAMTLHGITALPPAAPCRRFSDCPVDPGTAARDRLAELTRGQKIICTSVPGTAKARERSVRCTRGGVDLTCTMLADGHGKASVSGLGCSQVRAAETGGLWQRGGRDFAALSNLWRWGVLYLIILSAVTYFAFTADQRRERRALNRISESHLLALVLFGGGFGGLAAQITTGHMRDTLPFANQFAVLLGLQIGALIGIFGLGQWSP